MDQIRRKIHTRSDQEEDPRDKVFDFSEDFLVYVFGLAIFGEI